MDIPAEGFSPGDPDERIMQRAGPGELLTGILFVIAGTRKTEDQGRTVPETR